MNMEHATRIAAVAAAVILGFSGSSVDFTGVPGQGFFEAEKGCAQSDLFVLRQAASGGRCVAPLNSVAWTSGTFLPRVAGSYRISVGYRTTGSKFALSGRIAGRVMGGPLPESSEFAEISLGVAYLDSAESFKVDVSGQIELDYVVIEAEGLCVGCEVILGDDIVDDGENGGVGQPGDLDNFGDFTSTGNGGYNAIGDVNPSSDDPGIMIASCTLGLTGGGGLVAAGTTVLVLTPVGWVLVAISGAAATGATVWQICQVGGQVPGVQFKVSSYSLKAVSGECGFTNGACGQTGDGCKLLLSMIMSMPSTANGSEDGDNRVLTTTNNHDEGKVGDLVPGDATQTVAIMEVAEAECGDDGYILLEWGDGDDIFQIDFECDQCTFIPGEDDKK